MLTEELKKKWDDLLLESQEDIILGSSKLLDEIKNLVIILSKNPDLDKRQWGLEINELKSSIRDFLKNIKEKNKEESLIIPDLSVALYMPAIGSIHPLSYSIKRLRIIMEQLGFCFKNSPHVDTVENNFDSLNIGEDHPSRTEHDTFFLNQNLVLRTHTTATTVHSLKETTKNLKIFTVGKVFRNDSDNTHSPMFHQLEAYYEDSDSSLGTMIYTINYMLDKFFEKKMTMRTRPSFFPFTSPSMEIDVLFNNKWLEIGGCGMVHSQVFKKCDREGGRAFAFGMGVERLCMLKYEIQDLRYFYQNRDDIVKSRNLHLGVYI